MKVKYRTVTVRKLECSKQAIAMNIAAWYNTNIGFETLMVCFLFNGK